MARFPGKKTAVFALTQERVAGPCASSAVCPSPPVTGCHCSVSRHVFSASCHWERSEESRLQGSDPYSSRPDPLPGRRSPVNDPTLGDPLRQSEGRFAWPGVANPQPRGEFLPLDTVIGGRNNGILIGSGGLETSRRCSRGPQGRWTRGFLICP